MFDPQYPLDFDVDACLLYALALGSLAEGFRGVDPSSRHPPRAVLYVYGEVLAGVWVLANDQGNAQNLRLVAFLHGLLMNDIL